MTESVAAENIRDILGECTECESAICYVTNVDAPALDMALKSLENQEKIKEIIANANQWSKEDVVVKAQAFCNIEKILRSDESEQSISTQELNAEVSAAAMQHK